MPLDRSTPALFAVALLLNGCPPGLHGSPGASDPLEDDEGCEDDCESDDEECEDDWEIDDDDIGVDDDDASPLPVIEGECGRYAWLNTPGTLLSFDGWPDELIAVAGSEPGLVCAVSGDDEYDAWDCYSCDEVGVRQVSSSWAGGGWCELITYDDPPLVWRHDAAPGSSWTADWSGELEDCSDGGWESIEASETVEVVDEESVVVPAGSSPTLVVRRVRTDTSGERWSWVSEGLGPIQEGWSREEIDLQLMEVDGL